MYIKCDAEKEDDDGGDDDDGGLNFYSGCRETMVVWSMGSLLT